MGAHLIFFIIFTLFSCIILTNQSLPWYSLQSGFQCDTKMAAVFSCMRPTEDDTGFGKEDGGGWVSSNYILNYTHVQRFFPLV